MHDQVSGRMRVAESEHIDGAAGFANREVILHRHIRKNGDKVIGHAAIPLAEANIAFEAAALLLAQRFAGVKRVTKTFDGVGNGAMKVVAIFLALDRQVTQRLPVRDELYRGEGVAI